MIKSSTISVAADESAIQSEVLAPPGWVAPLLSASSCQEARLGALHVTTRQGRDFTLTSVRLPDAKRLSAPSFEAGVFEIYRAITGQFSQIPHDHPVRFWNHIPAIHEQLELHRDRYMVFNAGRYKALLSWHGGIKRLEREVAAASGVGHDGHDLIVHCLSTGSDVCAVQNPRQIAPHLYSQRFGPLPPCFARATYLRDSGLLIVGGTASVYGEDSLHRQNLPAQFHETVLNLAAVVRAASHDKTETDAQYLKKFMHLRVYFPNSSDAGLLQRMVRGAFPQVSQIEMCHADLCRAELLVEIEGVATIAK